MRPGGKKAKRMRKALSGQPKWAVHAAISKQRRGSPVTGTFGPASPVVSIDPSTLPPSEGA